MLNPAAKEAWNDYLNEKDPVAQEMAYQQYLRELLRVETPKERDELDEHAAQMPIGLGHA